MDAVLQNPKSQIPNLKKMPNFKSQAKQLGAFLARSKNDIKQPTMSQQVCSASRGAIQHTWKYWKPALQFRFWSLGCGIVLGFGIWDLGFLQHVQAASSSTSSSAAHPAQDYP